MKRILAGLALAAATLLMASCCGQPDIAGKWNILKVNGEDRLIVKESDILAVIND